MTALWTIGPLLAALAWTVAVLALVGCAVCSVLSALRRSLALVITQSALLAGALFLAALPTTPAPAAVTVPLTLAALVAAVAGGSGATREVLGRGVRDTEEGPSGGVVADDGRELLRGGQVIGLLERLAVTGVVVAGYPEGLAIIVAIKGVGRFSDLVTSPARERFVIGTFTSWIWAAACALVVVLARH